jgi:hypothetical protein
MGLDGVEFVMAVEETFGLAIPDQDAQELLTPGHVVRYLEGRLQSGQSACLELRAFYMLRRAAISVLNLPRSACRLSTRWDAVLPPRGRRRTWRLMRHATGVVPWPTIWLWGSVSGRHATMGDTARHIATYGAAALQKPGAGWSHSQIEGTIRRLMSDQLGINDFKWDQRFVEDLGVR